MRISRVATFLTWFCLAFALHFDERESEPITLTGLTLHLLD
jgi:hypothetical protein